MNRSWITIVGSVGLVVGAVCLGGEPENRQLLETLPSDRRASLAENLDDFDKLDFAEQTAIRRLDASIAATEPVEQARYRALLHHYHLWFESLTDDQQEKLLATTDLDERFALARKIRVAENGRDRHDGSRIAHLRTGAFGLIGPFEAAFLLKTWQDLAPEKRAELEKSPPAKLRDALKAEAKTLKRRIDRFPAEQAKIYGEKLEADPEFQPIIEPMIRRVEQAFRKGDAGKKAANAQKLFEHPLAEFRYFEENRPRPVDPIRLERFAEACPGWFRATTDSLAADDARDYYAILYRLIYPNPAEMPEPVKPATTAPQPGGPERTPQPAHSRGHGVLILDDDA